MKVLLTGASGFLGAHVAEALCARGHEVFALVRESSATELLEPLDPLLLVYGSVEDRAALDDVIPDVDAVIHCAGLIKTRAGHPEDFYGVNVRGTENLVRAIAERARPGFRCLVAVSSLAAVGPSADGQPVDPQANFPVTEYGRSKRHAEDVVRAAAHRVPSVIVRPPMIYGPRDRETLALFRAIARGVLPRIGDGTNRMSVIYGPDAAAACVAAVEAAIGAVGSASAIASGDAFFIDDGHIHTWRDMLADMEAALETRARVRVGIPRAALYVAGAASEVAARLSGRPVMLTRDKVNELAAPHWVCDASPARAAFAWEPAVAWAEGTRRAVAWYREAGWL